MIKNMAIAPFTSIAYKLSHHKITNLSTYSRAARKVILSWLKLCCLVANFNGSAIQKSSLKTTAFIKFFGSKNGSKWLKKLLLSKTSSNEEISNKPKKVSEGYKTLGKSKESSKIVNFYAIKIQ